MGFALAAALLIAAPWSAAWATTIEVRPVASTDDAEEFASGSMYLNSTDLELIHDTSDQTVGIRWINLAIPPGATITAAYIQFSCKDSWPDLTNLTFACQAADNAATFSSTNLDVSSRPRTSNVMTWSPNVWLAAETGPNEKTNDMSQVIGEVVGRAGWASGNALAVIITGTGHRNAYSWDGKAGSSPLLHIEYTTGTPPPDAAPVARLTLSQLASPALTIKADGATSTDTDATPIATYHFDFGDNSPIVDTTAPTATANHTYASTGTYTVTLTCTDSGNLTSSPVSKSITVTSAPPVDNPPVAQLSVSQLASPKRTVMADGSGSTDTDATPIATYHFNFGDGSAVVNTTAPTATANHTYANSGTYTVKLTCTDTGNLTSSQVSKSITVTVDNPPVAQLSVSQLASPALTVKADGSGSTDTDATPIATYHFDFGDNSAVVNTTAPTATANHTYASAGTYTVKLTCTDSGNLNSSQVSKSITVTPPVTGGGTVAVFGGYYDTHHPNHLKPKPSLWKGSANTVFVGSPDKSGGNDWDCCAVRVDNLTSSTLSGVVVSVDVGSKHFALWGSNSIPAGSHLILTQTAFENFDGSDLNSAGCYSCNPNDCLTKVLSTKPVVHVTVNGTTTNYTDVTQLLNTGGVDRAGCPYTGTRNDESEDWVQIAPSAPFVAASEAAEQEGTGVPHDPPGVARQTLWLGDPYPNPSHGEVAVHFSVPESGPVKLEVFDVTGRQIRVALDQVLDAGEYEENAKLWGASPGVYFYRLTTHQGQQRRTFVIGR